MGYWNGTCMISNLPIMGGEPVVGFVIAYSGFADTRVSSGMCYPTDMATPISLPIHGCYDDYGGIENINENSVAARHLLHIFDEEDINKLVRDIERDERKIHSNILDKEVNVGIVMINQYIYNSLIQSRIPNKREPSIDKIMNGMKDLKELESKEDSFRNTFSKELKLSTEDIERMIRVRRPSSALGVSVDILEDKDFTDMVNCVLKMMNGYDESIAKEFAELVSERWILKSKMHGLRKCWIGQSGRGSQQRDYRSHLVLADAIKKHIFDSFDGPEDAYLTLLGKRDW